MGEKGEGSGGEGGGKWGERGRELGMGYPPVHPLKIVQIMPLSPKMAPLRVSHVLNLIV